jgi:PQQ-dependent catabolism-associated CXXCW motif protein
VLPRRPKPENLPKNVIWRDPPRDNIPDSVWLPNVGFGALAPEVETYFRSNLARLTKGRKDTGILFYCQAECWMSWNSAKRAVGLGYTAVYWYPEGTDGWAATGGELERSEPVPLPR